MIEIKATNTRKKFICTNRDRIMFNGSCYQLITQTFFREWSRLTPVISEKEFKRLQELDVLSKPYKVKGNMEVIMYEFRIKEEKPKTI